VIARRAAWIGGGLVALLLASVGGCVSWFSQSPDFFWAMFRDSREYPHSDDPMHITKGHGDLENDLLPHFLVRLPCDATAVRYGEWEDIGPAGWLALRFETSPSCLDAFVRENGLKSVSADPIPASEVPHTYGWDLTTTTAYYSAEPSEDVRLSVAIDNRSSRPTVYAWSTYY
jgi:hypothetical protein